MTGFSPSRTRLRKRLRLANWSLLVLLQGISALFFIGDVSTEILYGGLVIHTVLEGVATLALVFGVGLGAVEVWKTARSATEAEESLRVARAAFSARVRDQFAAWALSPSEADVALLMLKGFDIAEIAEIRQTAQGTVRAQLSSIYRKSGHASRGRFVSAFLDVLIDRPDTADAPRP